MKLTIRSVHYLTFRRAAILLTVFLFSIAGFKFEGDSSPLKAFGFKKVSQKQYFGEGKGCNLIVVQLESFQNFVVNLSVQDQEITPVLNNLSTKSIYFPNTFQQIGRGNTSDAEFTSNTSIYPVGDPAMSSAYADREFPSMAKLMHAQGYTANTFHVNEVSFWNRNRLYPAIGFDKYYDKPYFKQEIFNRFGASDEELYTVAIDKLLSLQRNNKLFYAQLVTVSSHSPFKIPEASKRLKLNWELNGTPLGNYLTAVNYADHALGTFIEKLKNTGLWDNSVLVVYGDHFGLNKKKFDAKKLSQALGIRYHKQISTLNVPFLIHLPGRQSGRRIELTGGQIDILPTVANIMGVDLKSSGFTAFGQDLLNVKHNIIGIRYYLPTGSFLNDEILFIPGKKGFEDGKATSIRTLQPLKDIEPYRSDYEVINRLMKQSDKYVKQLPVRL